MKKLVTAIVIAFAMLLTSHSVSWGQQAQVENGGTWESSESFGGTWE